MAENLKGLQESLDHIIKHMATKDDVRDIVREEVSKMELATRADVRDIIRDMDVATKEDIKGIVSSAHNRIDQEGISRKQLEVRVINLEKHVGV